MAAKYHCNYCDEDINDVRVKCSECLDFDLCLECFACGAEIGAHRSSHGYQLIDCGTFPIFGAPEEWMATEEVALLEAVELYGFGNWEDTADFVGTRNAEEVQEHFVKLYVEGNIGRVTWLNAQDSYDITDHTCSKDGPLSPSLTAPLPSILELSIPEQQHLGYMPKRDDFEREYDNEAEALVSTLNINVNDEEDLDRELKVAHIDMYKRRLSERFRRKSVARDYGLVNLFYKSLAQDEELMAQMQLQTSLGVGEKVDSNQNQNIQPKSGTPSKKKGGSPVKSNEEKKDPLLEKLKPFSQYQSAIDQKILLENMQKEKELKSRIKELTRFRRNGLKSLAEVAAYELARTKRDKKKENKKNKGISGASIGSGHNERSKGSTPTSQTKKSGSTDGSKREVSTNSNASNSLMTINSGSNSSNSEKVSSNARDSPNGLCSVSNSGPSGRRGVGGDGLKSTDDSKSRSPAKAPVEDDFDVNSLPSSRLLSEKEKKLCASIRLRPSHYVTLKTLILKEQGQKKVKGSSSLKSSLENVDKSVRRRVFGFMVRSGWLSTSS